jgi:hypothetical protein
MSPEKLVGRTITNIFDNSELYELGAHQISNWTRNDKLIAFKKPAWAVQNKFDVIGKKIVRVIQKDPKEYYAGSITLLLDNNIIMEHLTSNGDELHIDEFYEED